MAREFSYMIDLNITNFNTPKYVHVVYFVLLVKLNENNLYNCIKQWKCSFCRYHEKS